MRETQGSVCVFNIERQGVGGLLSTRLCVCSQASESVREMEGETKHLPITRYVDGQPIVNFVCLCVCVSVQPV